MASHPKWPARPALHVVMGPDRAFHVGRAGRIRVPAGTVRFAVDVVEDLCRADETAEGVAVIDACEQIAGTIEIARLDGPIDPPNGLVEPVDRVAATLSGQPTGLVDEAGRPILGTGSGSGSVIRYDPKQWPWEGDPASPPSWRVLLLLLQQALVLARGMDDPSDGRACLVPGEP